MDVVPRREADKEFRVPVAKEPWTEPATEGASRLRRIFFRRVTRSRVQHHVRKDTGYFLSSNSDFQPISEVDNGESSIELLPETDAETWLMTHVQSTEHIMLSRIPTWSIEGVTTCVFPEVVALHWMLIKYKHIGKAETGCVHIKNVEGKGKGCMAARAVVLGESVARERALLVMPRTCLPPAAS